MLRILTLFAALVCLSCTNKQKQLEQRQLANLHLKIGTGYLTQANYPLAIKELRIAQKLDPKNAAICNNLGLAYYLRKEIALAEQQFLLALKYNPNFTEARNNLSRVYIDTKRYPKAILELKIAVQDLTYPRPEKTWTNLGFAYLMSKEFDSARQSLIKAMELNRSYCPAYTMYGRTLFEEKKFAKAVDSLDQAIKKCKNERFDEPVYYSALSNLRLGRVEKAKAKLQEVVTAYPDGKFAQKARSILKMIR